MWVWCTLQTHTRHGYSFTHALARVNRRRYTRCAFPFSTWISFSAYIQDLLHINLQLFLLLYMLIHISKLQLLNAVLSFSTFGSAIFVPESGPITLGVCLFFPIILHFNVIVKCLSRTINQFEADKLLHATKNESDGNLLSVYTHSCFTPQIYVDGCNSLWAQCLRLFPWFSIIHFGKSKIKTALNFFVSFLSYLLFSPCHYAICVCVSIYSFLLLFCILCYS